jgi:three-Cys-motif partner protein
MRTPSRRSFVAGAAGNPCRLRGENGKRPDMLSDSDIRKWVCQEHTRVKHVLLEKYLRAWIPILGKWNPRIVYFDGFAGRGEYADGTPGSPILAVRVADELSDHFGQIGFTFVENDPDNYANLSTVLDREKAVTKHLGKMTFRQKNGDFHQIAGALLDFVDKLKADLVPSFFFIDPFGFTGVPFEIVRRILASAKTEVFFTFMLRDVNRFLELPQLAGQLSVLFGGDNWRGVIENPDRQRALVELYRSQLHDVAGAKYSLQFKVCESNSTATLYHLVHANNSYKGHTVMKSIMYNQGVAGTFAFLGRDDLAERTQMKLFDVNDPRQVRAVLQERFADRSLTFDEICEAVCRPWYSEPPFLEKHYRAALKQLEDDGLVSVERRTSKTPRGLAGADRVAFGRAQD